VIADGGSIARVECIPADLKLIYRTVWEVKQRSLIDMAAERGVFIDQSQVRPPSHDSPRALKDRSIYSLKGAEQARSKPLAYHLVYVHPASLPPLLRVYVFIYLLID
jgi:hypothetical protein